MFQCMLFLILILLPHSLSVLKLRKEDQILSVCKIKDFIVFYPPKLQLIVSFRIFFKVFYPPFLVCICTIKFKIFYIDIWLFFFEISQFYCVLLLLYRFFSMILSCFKYICVILSIRISKVLINTLTFQSIMILYHT